MLCLSVSVEVGGKVARNLPLSWLDMKSVRLVVKRTKNEIKFTTFFQAMKLFVACVCVRLPSLRKKKKVTDKLFKIVVLNNLPQRRMCF